MISYIMVQHIRRGIGFAVFAEDSYFGEAQIDFLLGIRIHRQKHFGIPAESPLVSLLKAVEQFLLPVVWKWT